MGYFIRQLELPCSVSNPQPGLNCPQDVLKRLAVCKHVLNIDEDALLELGNTNLVGYASAVEKSVEHSQLIVETSVDLEQPHLP